MRDVVEPLSARQTVTQRPRPLVVGLVNNMSDGARKATDEQFTRLLRAACPQFEISLELFSCRATCRKESDVGTPVRAHRDATELFGMHLDAVIVTGMEPQAADLQDEPIWASLTEIVDWAQETGVPVIWSCLAAHAAVFYLDAIRRSRLPVKLSGVFDCELVAFEHPVTTGLPGRWSTPHSRHNGLSESSLVSAGYQILSRSVDAGVDCFLKPGLTPQLFFQGHPEYHLGSLLSEYVRDVRRYLVGQQDEYPLVPCNCLDAGLEARLDDHRSYVTGSHRDLTELKEVLRLTTTASKISPWFRPAARLYANWIAQSVDIARDRNPVPLASGFHVVRQLDPANLGGAE